MHALRHVDQLLAPGGTLVDIHPVTEERVESAGNPLGVILEQDWALVDLPNSEAARTRRSARGFTYSRLRRNTTWRNISTIPTS